MQSHITNMQKQARNQRYERRQPETPRKAHRRAVQAANKQMRERLYAPKEQSQKSRPPRKAPRRPPDASSHIASLGRPPLRHHPP